MNPLRRISEQFGSFILRRRIQLLKRERTACNLQTAESAGILFKIDGATASFEKVNEFLKYLTKQKIKVFALGYFNGKNIPMMYLNKKGINIFGKKQLNWYQAPDSSIVKEFMNKKFDLLIDLNCNGTFPLKYVTSLSKARFKVGRLRDQNEPYDFIIDIQENEALDYYIEQLKHYLSNIKV